MPLTSYYDSNVCYALWKDKNKKPEDFTIIYSIESKGWSVAYCVKFHRDKHITSRLAGIICFVKEG